MHLLRISVGRTDREFARRMEAVAEGAVARGEPERADRNHVASVQRHQPVRRPRKLHGRVAIGELVAHHLGDRQTRERFIQRGLQAGLQRAARGHAGQEHRLGLAVLFKYQSVGVSSIGRSRPAIGQRLASDRRQFLAQCRRGLAGFVQRDCARHQLLAERLVRRGGAHLADVHGEPAWCAVGGGLRRRLKQLACAQALVDAGRERLRQRAQRFRRQLFGIQFDQQRGGHHAAS